MIINGYVKLNFKDFEDFISWAIVAILLGGRIGYVIFYNLEFFIDNPIEVIKIWKGGMSFHGGLIGLILSASLFCKIKKIDLIDLSNLVAACGPLGIFLGRIANFVNGELVGRPTNTNWGIIYKNKEFPRHPSQLYEAFCEGLLIFIIIYLVFYFKLHKKINVFAIFFLIYGFFRFILEFYREPDQHLGFIIINLSMGQLLSFPMILIGIIFLRFKK